MENTMQHKRKVCLSVTILCLLASLLATGCGGADSKKGALAPSGKSGVDAVLQQQMNAADTKAGGGQNRAAEGQAGGAAKTPAPVSARQMKEMEEKIPRMDVYDEKPIYTKVDYDFSKMNRNRMYRGPSVTITTKRPANIITDALLPTRPPAARPVWSFPAGVFIPIRGIILK